PMRFFQELRPLLGSFDYYSDKRPKPFRETIPKEEDNSNSKGAKIVDDKPAVRTDQSNLINTTTTRWEPECARLDYGRRQREDFVRVESRDMNQKDIAQRRQLEKYQRRKEGKRGEMKDWVTMDDCHLITVEDNEEDLYESEGSSSEETIGEVYQRGNEGLGEGKLEEGNDGDECRWFEPIVVKDPFVLTRVVGDWSIYVTPLLMGKDKYELIKRGGVERNMPSWDESGRLEASPLGQVWAGVLRAVDGENKFESIRLKLTLESYLISVTEKLLKMALNKIIDHTWTLKMQQTLRGDNSSMKPGSETKTSKVMSDGGINIGRTGTIEENHLKPRDYSNVVLMDLAKWKLEGATKRENFGDRKANFIVRNNYPLIKKILPTHSSLAATG
ncbi:hypothetical protein BY996DRAFT_6585742, partial [Phakopsora pachyrhizi]